MRQEKIILFIVGILISLCPHILEAKGIPVDANGVKRLEYNQSGEKLQKQIDKKEYDQIKTIVFICNCNTTLTLDKGFCKVIEKLPNLEDIYFELGAQYPKRQRIRSDEEFQFTEKLPQIKSVYLSKENSLELIDLQDGFNEISSFPNANKYVITYTDLDQEIKSLPNTEDDKYLVLGAKHNSYVPTIDRTNKCIIWEQKNATVDNANIILGADYILPSAKKINIPKNVVYWKNGLRLSHKKELFEDCNEMVIEESDTPLVLEELIGGSQGVNRPIITNYLVNGDWVFNKDFTAYERVGSSSKPSIIEFNGNANLNGDLYVEEVKFAKIPKFPGGKVKFKGTEKPKKVVSPPGKVDDLIALGFDPKVIGDISFSSRADITLQEPGTILSEISIDKLKSVTDLKVSGILYDTDIKVLNECSSLRNLDLSDALIFNSPETLAEKRRNDEFTASFFNMLRSLAERKRETMSDESLIALDILKEAASAELNLENQKMANSTCLPSESFANKVFLEKVILPKVCNNIGSGSFSYCISLKEIIFPINLARLAQASFYGCTELKHVILPETLEEVGVNTFGNCTNIMTIDFSKCKFKADNRGRVLWENPLLRVTGKIYLPSNITQLVYFNPAEHSEIYFPENLKIIGGDCSLSGKTLHFKSKSPMEIYCGIYRSTICVPKGGITAWYAKYGDSCKIIEE